MSINILSTFSSLLCISLMLNGCSVRHIPDLDTELTVEGANLLREAGLVIKAPWVKDASQLSILIRENGRIVANYDGSDCNDVAAHLLSILTLTLVPLWCPHVVTVCYVDQNEKCGKTYRLKYSEEYTGFFVAPLSLLPGWRFMPDESKKGSVERFDRGLVTLTNQIAVEWR